MNNNKLIAEFMGVHDEISLDSIAGNIHSWSDSPFFYITEDSKDKVMEGITKYSKYHTSWDWLMPVIKTIRDHVNVDMGFEEYDNWRENFKQIDPYNYNLSECYKAVVEFIKTYNNDTI
mgnify:CR=1 FL=1